MDWETVYRKHSQGIYQYLLNLSGQQQSAEDLLQETFIKAMRSESSLNDTSKLHSWLMTIARNLFLDSYKKHSRRKTSSVGNFGEEGACFESSEKSPEEYAVNSDFIGRLQKELGILSETYRTAFTMGIMQKMSYSEIAEITGWSAAMVKSNIFRARKKIAVALNDFQG